MTTQHPAGDGDTRPTDRERLAQTACLADDTMEHHEQTNDFPCSRCLHYADLFLAARAPAPPDAVQARRLALLEAADGIVRGAGLLRPPGGRQHPAVIYLRDLAAADRLAAEPDAATRTVQVEEPLHVVYGVVLDDAGSTDFYDTAEEALRWAAEGEGDPVVIATHRLRAAADPGTRGEGDDRG